MKIAVFGASGQTGLPLVRLALERGYSVNAFVRNPAKIPFSHPDLSVVEGDVTDVPAVEKAVAGADAVISVLNAGKQAADMPLTQGMRNIIRAMKKNGIRRLIVSSSAPCAADPEDVFNLKYAFFTGLVGFLVQSLLKNQFNDISGSVQAVKETGLEWTVVRMPAPVNRETPGIYRAGFVDKKSKLRISRANAALFLLDEIKEARFIRRTPVVFDG